MGSLYRGAKFVKICTIFLCRTVQSLIFTLWIRYKKIKLDDMYCPDKK